MRVILRLRAFVQILLLLLITVSSAVAQFDPNCNGNDIPIPYDPAAPDDEDLTQQDLRLLTDEYQIDRCPASDIQIVLAFFETDDPCNTCTPGESVTANLFITIDHGTNSGDRHLGVFADVVETLADGTQVTCPLVRCAGSIPGGGVHTLDYGEYTFTCGSELELTDILLVWTAANGNCPITLGNNPNGKYCYANGTFQIEPPAQATIETFCSSAQTMSTNLVTVGMVGPFSYLWSNGATTENLTDVPLGTYAVTVTDLGRDDGAGNACTVETSVTFNGPCCIPMAECALVDIDETGCVLPPAFTDPADVFNIIDACDLTPSMTVVETGVDAMCADGTPFTATRSYTMTIGAETFMCSHTITITPPPLVLSACPADVSFAACAEQADVDAAFNTWVAAVKAMTFSGGCAVEGLTFSVDTSTLADLAPDICNPAGTNISMEISVEDTCGVRQTCTTVFSVAAYPDDLGLSATCSADPQLDGCADQATIDAAWSTWLNALMNIEAVGGCNPVLNMSSTIATISALKPIACVASQQQVSVDIWATDDCVEIAPMTCTFTVAAYPADLALSATCPGDPALTGCATQADIDAAWTAWTDALSMITTTGGCAAEVVYSTPIADLVKPLECATTEQQVSITLSASDLCVSGVDEMTCTFTVGAYPADLGLSASCPGDPNLTGCATQAEIDAAWSAWTTAIGAISATGTCSPTLVMDPPLAQLVAPSECTTADQVVTVEISATDHCQTTAPITCTFSVAAYADDLALSATCPGDPNLSGCASQAEIDAAWTAWTSALSAIAPVGGCTPTMNYSTPIADLVAPVQCGTAAQVVSIDISASDLCSSTAPITCTFTVGAYPADLALSAQCPGDPMLSGCATQAEIDAAWSAWISAVQAISATGGCSPTMVYSTPLSSLVPPVDCNTSMQMVSIDISAEDLCSSTAPITCTFTVEGYVDDLALSGCPADQAFGECADQAAVTAAFDAWVADLQSITSSGGCNPGAVTYSVDPASLASPIICDPAGYNYSVTVSVAGDCGAIDECTTTFAVTGFVDDIALSACPPSVTFAQCIDQVSVTNAFNAWVADLQAMASSGGCNPEDVAFSVDPASLAVPDVCSTDGTRYTVTVSVADGCTGTDECTSLFIVSPYVDDLALSACPISQDFASCTDQALVTAAFDLWISQLTNMISTGGCFVGDLSYSVDPASLATPDICNTAGTAYEVTVSVTDACGSSDVCVTSFNVGGYVDDLVLSDCPAPVSFGTCSDQSAVELAFDQWIADLRLMNVTGGCFTSGVTYSVDPLSLATPSVCSTAGTNYEVTVSATDQCGASVSCMSSFTVAAYLDDLTLDACPADVSLGSCLEQLDVTAAFVAWVDELNNMSVSGGCGNRDIIYSQQPNSLPTPDVCSGSSTSYTIDVFVRDVCGSTQSCSSTFTLAANADAVEVTCPDLTVLNLIFNCTLTETDLQAAYDAWMAGFSISGDGCGATGGFTVAPPADLDWCDVLLNGADITAEYSATDGCTDASCTSRFVVFGPGPIRVRCPDPTQIPNRIDACAGQDAIDAAFQTWLDGFNVVGLGCGLTSVTDLSQYTAPLACSLDDQTVTVVFQAADLCSSDECTASFTVTGTVAPTIDCSMLPTEAECAEDAVPGTPEFSMDCGPGTLEITDTTIVGQDGCDGTTYTYTFVVTDDCGRTASCQQTITLINDGPTVDCAVTEDLVMECNSDYASQIMDWLDATVSALDETVVVSCDLGYDISIDYSGEVPDVSCNLSNGELVTFTVTDECGRSVSCSAMIFVDDTQAPYFTGPAPQDTAIQCSEALPPRDFEILDDCSGVNLTLDSTIVQLNDCEYDILRTWRAVDACGNVFTHSQLVEVRDTEAPTITLSDELASNISNGQMVVYGCGTPAVPMTGALVDDNCCIVPSSLVTFDKLIGTGTCDIFGFHSRWECGYIVSDAAGNITEYSFEVVQYDTTAPVIMNLPPDLALACNTQVSPADTGAVFAMDECRGNLEGAFTESTITNPENPVQMAIMRTWSFIDECGNRSSATQTITLCDFVVDGNGSGGTSQFGSVGNRIWLDDGDGIQEREEPGLNRVRIDLYSQKPDGSLGEAVLTTTSATALGILGQYRFDFLMDGNYVLKVEVPRGYELTQPNIYGNSLDQRDSDADQATGLIPGIVIRNGAIINDVDVGLVKKPSDSDDMYEYEESEDERSRLSKNDPYPWPNNKVVDTEKEDQSETEIYLPFDEVHLYPNPTSGNAVLEFHSWVAQEGQLVVRDNYGKVLHQRDFGTVVGFNRMQVDLYDYPTGIYMLQLSLDNKQIVKRVVKN